MLFGLGLAPVVVALAGLLLGGASSCDLPSGSVDAGDLLGVFERDAASSSGIIATSPSASSSGTSAAASAPRITERAPSSATCTEPGDAPMMEVRRTVKRPACRGAEILETKDASGAPRYGCVYAPRDAEKKKPLPLIVFFHGDTPGLDDASTIVKLTSVARRSGEPPFEAGFIVLSVQGRALGEEGGVTFDLSNGTRENLDIATTTSLVEKLSKERGWVDASQIYALGMGAGGAMAATYAMVRADRIAAFASFGAPPPTVKWVCPGSPPAAMLLYRACDSQVSCGDIETWIASREALRAETSALRLGEDVKEESFCATKATCGPKKGNANHNRWPKGREKDLLSFFANHRLKAQPSE